MNNARDRRGRGRGRQRKDRSGSVLGARVLAGRFIADVPPGVRAVTAQRAVPAIEYKGLKAP